MTTKKRGLNKGLEVLLGDATKVGMTQEAFRKVSVSEIKTEELVPGRFQPRKQMDEGELNALAQSVSAQGILQPIIVRPLPNKEQYEIIAGERRWRAATLAGLESVPVIVKVVPDQDVAAIALIENIQRENLNPVEEAQALLRLSKDFGMTHAQVAEVVGKSRTSITNLLRLLNLRSDVKILLETGGIEVGHAKVLLGVSGSLQSKFAKIITTKKLSVRETEVLIAKQVSDGVDPIIKSKDQSLDPDLQRLQVSLSEKVGCPVKIKHGPDGRGKLVIKYNSLDELEGVLEHIK